MKKTVKPVIETPITKPKKNVKKANPVYTVDIIDAFDEYDVALAVAYAKLDADVELSNAECKMIAGDIFDSFVETMFKNHNGLVMLSNKRIARIDLDIIEVANNSFIIAGIHRNSPNPSLLASNVENETVEIEKPNFLRRFWNWICGK